MVFESKRPQYRLKSSFIPAAYKVPDKVAAPDGDRKLFPCGKFPDIQAGQIPS